MATITATCGNTTGCPLESIDYKATLTIGMPTGDDGKAVLTASPSGAFDISTLQSQIKYSSKQNGTWTSVSETPPTGDGIHMAEITLGEGNNKAKASVTYGRNAITY